MIQNKAYFKAYYKTNKLKVKERGAAYYQRNRKKIDARNKKTRENNIDRYREYDREYSRKAYAALSPEQKKERYQKTKEKQRGYKLKGKYGLSLEEYDKLNKAQNGLCSICNLTNKKRHLVVDHCHTTGRIRGLLCTMCNYKLGWYEACQTEIESYLKNN